MIEYLKGTVDELLPTSVTIECGGVGYLANISLITYSAIQGKPSAKLYIYEAIREDAYVLYGFATRQERDLFLLLISVSGVGGNTARTILSAYSPAELADILMNENTSLLKSVKGVGPKMAQRIIVDLKDKVAALGVAPEAAAAADSPVSAANKQAHDDAVEALKALGFPPAPVAKTVKAILKEHPDATAEQIIKMAFKML